MKNLSETFVCRPAARNKRRSLLPLLMLVLFAVTGVSHAQSVTGDVVGTVTDSGGAVIPGATVTIVNVGTQEKRTATSSSNGDYTFNLLQPGKYTLRATAGGFKELSVSAFNLSAGDRTRVNAVLPVGAVSDVVEVAGDTVPALQTDSGSIQTTVSARAVQDLPLNGRNFVNLVQVTAGINQGLAASIGSGARPDDRRQTSAFSANGQPDTQNNNMIDGLDNNERIQGFIGVRPSIDAISEIRIQTNSYSAETGRSTGAVVNVITKGGTNSFHGTLFEFVRNDIFDARNYYARTGVTNKPEVRQNDFGGSIGGPIWKNHTFFFGDIEFDRSVTGSTQTVSVPTLQEETNFDFTDRAGGTVLNPAQISPVVLRYFQLFPKPTSTALVNNFTASPATTQFAKTIDARIDHHFSANDLFFVHYLYNPVTTTVPGVLPSVTPSWSGGLAVQPGGIIGAFAGPSTSNSQGVHLDYTHIFNPNLVLELRAGYTGIKINSLPLNYGNNLSNKIGVVNGNLGDQLTSALTVVRYTDGSASTGDGTFIPLLDHNNTFQYNGVLTYTHGAHSIKAGGALVRRQLNYYQSAGSPQGQFYAANFQNALLGTFRYTARANLSNLQGFRSWEPSGFVQDDWRATAKLTLNLGVRYEVFTPFHEAHNIYSNFDLASLSVKLASNSNPAIGVATDYKDISPRFGFALQLPQSTVVRGGYGISYYPIDIQGLITNTNPPYGYVCNNSCPPTTFPVLPLPPAPSAVSLTNPSGNLTYKPPTFRPGYFHQMNLVMEKEFGGNVFSVAYVGSLGRRLLFQEDINRPAPQTTAQPAGTPAPARVYATQLPNVGQIQENTNQGVNNYNSLQTSYVRRYRQGLTINLNYTWAHGLGDSVNPSANNQNGLWTGNPHYDYSNTAVDIRHRAAISANYELPFGKTLTGAAALFGKGWAVNSIAFWQTGAAYGVSNGVNAQINLPGVGTDRPNRYSSYSQIPQSVIATGKVQCLGGGQAGACFALQPFGTAGNAPQFSEYGPHQRAINLSFFKDFPVYREARLQFRAESFNITNTPNFVVPNSGFGSASFGTTSSTAANQNPRQLQLALKLAF